MEFAASEWQKNVGSETEWLSRANWMRVKCHGCNKFVDFCVGVYFNWKDKIFLCQQRKSCSVYHRFDEYLVKLASSKQVEVLCVYNISRIPTICLYLTPWIIVHVPALKSDNIFSLRFSFILARSHAARCVCACACEWKRDKRTQIDMKIYSIDNSLAADIRNLYTIDTVLCIARIHFIQSSN